MSRKTVEERLHQVESAEAGHKNATIEWLGVAAVSGAVAYTEAGFRPIGVGIGILSFLIAADSLINTTSYSREAASLRGVLAQDDLYQPDPIPELTEGQIPQFIDQDNDTTGLFSDPGI